MSEIQIPGYQNTSQEKAAFKEVAREAPSTPADAGRTPRTTEVGSLAAQEGCRSPSLRCRSFSDLEASSSPTSRCRTPRAQAGKDPPASPAAQGRVPPPQAKRNPSKPRSSSATKPVRPAPVIKPGLTTMAKERRLRVAILNDSKSSSEVHLAASICREALKWSPWFRSEALLKLKGTIIKRSTSASSTTLEQVAPIDVFLVRGSDVRAGILTGEALSKPPMDVFVVPGGGSEIYARCLGPQGRTQVRNFVLSGGGYVGVCAGAFLALKGWRKEMSLNLVDAFLLTHYCKAVRDDSKAAAEVTAETESGREAAKPALGGNECVEEVARSADCETENVAQAKEGENVERQAGHEACKKLVQESCKASSPGSAVHTPKLETEVDLSRRISLGSLLGSTETTPRPGSDQECRVKALDSSDEGSQTSSTCSGHSSWDSTSPQSKITSSVTTPASTLPLCLQSSVEGEASFSPVLSPSSVALQSPSVAVEPVSARKSLASGLMRPLALPWLTMRRSSPDSPPVIAPPPTGTPPPLVFANAAGNSPRSPGPIAKLLDSSRMKLSRSRSSPALTASKTPSLQTNSSSGSTSGVANSQHKTAAPIETPKGSYAARFRRPVSVGRSCKSSTTTEPPRRAESPRSNEGRGKGGAKPLDAAASSQNSTATTTPLPGSPVPALRPLSALPRSATPVTARPGYPTMLDDRSANATNAPNAPSLVPPTSNLSSTCPELPALSNLGLAEQPAATAATSPRSAAAAAAADVLTPGTVSAKPKLTVTGVANASTASPTTTDPEAAPGSPSGPTARAAGVLPDATCAAGSETDTEAGEKKPKRSRDAFHIFTEFTAEGKRLLWTEGDATDIRVEMRYHNGPLIGIPATSAAKSLATFQPRPQGPSGPPQMAGATAFVMEDVGLGRAVLISPHPESTTGQDGYYSLQQDPKPGKQRLRRVLQRAVLLAAAGKEELRWLESFSHIAG